MTVYRLDKEESIEDAGILEGFQTDLPKNIDFKGERMDFHTSVFMNERMFQKCLARCPAVFGLAPILPFALSPEAIEPYKEERWKTKLQLLVVFTKLAGVAPDRENGKYSPKRIFNSNRCDKHLFFYVISILFGEVC
jgi:hypothetical protein